MTEDGISPVPREARPYQGEVAGVVTRLIANTVDALVVIAVLLLGWAGFNVTLFMLDPRSFQATGASVVLTLLGASVVSALYLTGAWAATGRTYGDHVMGLRVVGGRGQRLRLPRAFARSLLYIVFPIGLLWCAISPARRSLQDLALRTQVVYDWQPRQHTVTLAVPPEART